MTREAPRLHLRVRSFKFETVPPYWFGGDPWRTRFFDAFSSMLPIGERLFIDSLRRAAAELTDPALDELVAAFSHQEGVHTREHRRYNERLRSQGYDLDGWDRTQKRMIDRLRGLASVRIPLAVTVAAEHVTASVGQAVLAHDLLADAHPEMKAFWEWHSAEEIEHKGAAFELFTRVGGGPDLRRAIMAWALVVIVARTGYRCAHMLRREGKLLDRATWKSAAAFLFGPKGLVALVGPDFRAFFRRDFHPWTQDTYDLVRAWEAAAVTAS